MKLSKTLLDSQDITNVPARTNYQREREAVAKRNRDQIYRGIGMILLIIAAIITIGIAGYSDALEFARAARS